MVFENTDGGKARFACSGGQDPDSTDGGPGSGVGGGDDDRRTDDRGRNAKPGGPVEVYQIGMFGNAPAVDDAVYYQTRAGGDGKPVTVGPFELTANQIKSWASKQTTNDINDLVERGQLRPQTALTLKSAQFDTMLNLMNEGQQLPSNTVQRFFPGDLQRVVYGKLCEGQPRRK